ncbi:MAG TPA: PQQ-dependent sugar dehydrogenase [Gemmatimonadaceae bacterium]|jgi:Glucose/sorbosone dehydrogenases
MMIEGRGLVVALAAVLAACGASDSGQAAASDSNAAAHAANGDVATACTGDNGGITLPDGFCATIFADSVGGARHITVASNGDVFVQLLKAGRGLESGTGQGGIVALRDIDHDGRADTSASFGSAGGTGIGLHGGFLYADDQKRIVRYQLAPGSLTPSGEAQAIVVGLPTGGHGARNFTFDSSGALYVNVGSRTNSCQQNDRAKESPGHDPCTELRTRAGIWKFDANKQGQKQSDETHFATGIRNGMGLTINPVDGKLYATQHGRDQLLQSWPKLFDAKQSAENPAEELVQVNKGDDFGWPYCFYSFEAKRLVLAPEYGGDGKKVGRCAEKKEPVTVFPGHWAPESAVFYTGTQFPTRYRGGVFVAFHGSWNRAPEPQAGFKVVFVPMKNGAPGSEYEAFADGFAGPDKSRNSANYRPMGLAQGPDGALYIADDKDGRIWKVRYTGNAAP